MRFQLFQGEISGLIRAIERFSPNGGPLAAFHHTQSPRKYHARQNKYVFTASLDVDPAKEDLFNEIYDTEHVPFLLKIPGVLAVTRAIFEPNATMRIDGQKIAGGRGRAEASGNRHGCARTLRP